MSNEEKKRRSNYRKRRQAVIVLLFVIVGILSLFSIIFGIGYARFSKEVYIEYNEKSDIDYKVHLKPNNFYEEEYLGKNHSYIATLIDHIGIDFDYSIEMATEDINYEYTYWVEAQLEIIDKTSNKPIYNPSQIIADKKTNTQSSNEKLTIKNNVNIDYDDYNLIANEFNEIYNLTDTSNNLIVSMYVNIKGQSEKFKSAAENSHVIKLIIPLTQKTVNISMTSSVPLSQSKVLACKNVTMEHITKNALIVFVLVDILAAFGLFLFAYVTRNTDINYTIKVRKIVNAYKSYIQKITNEFDKEGYHQLFVSTFNEMLDIRDTIQSPILMFENEDQTMTTFLIPTTTNILYTFEIKIDDYDKLYNNNHISPSIIPTEEKVETLVEEEIKEVNYEELEKREEIKEDFVVLENRPKKRNPSKPKLNRNRTNQTGLSEQVLSRDKSKNKSN